MWVLQRDKSVRLPLLFVYFFEQVITSLSMELPNKHEKQQVLILAR